MTAPTMTHRPHGGVHRHVLAGVRRCGAAVFVANPAGDNPSASAIWASPWRSA